MATGFIISIGVNKVDKKHYDGWDGALSVCEKDAKDMVKLAQKKGFTEANTTLLLTREATRENVLAAVGKAGKAMKEGDVLLVYYSGHGSQLDDTKNEEGDYTDETWCLYNGQLIDDELYLEWGKFKTGTRIILISDSCHSGDIARMAFNDAAPALTIKAMPKLVAYHTYTRNKSLYDKLIANIKSAEKKLPKKKAKDNLKSALLLIASCQDAQESIAETKKYAKNSLFTALLFETLKQKDISYGDLIAGTSALMNGDNIEELQHHQQEVTYQLLGKNTKSILKQKSFTI